MAKKVLSIVIGTECTKVCEVSYHKNNKNKGIRVYGSISFPTPVNTIEDGYIKDMDLFGEELQRQLKAGKLKSNKVIFSIASSKIANREIILPPTKEKKVMDIIATGASDYFPIDIKEYILSYLILEKKTSDWRERFRKKKYDKKDLKFAKQQEKFDKTTLKRRSKTELIAATMEKLETRASEQSQPGSENENNAEKLNQNKKHMRVTVYAVPSSLVKNYYNFANTMRFDIVSLDYSGNSSYQIIKRQVNRGTNVFVQMNEQDTLISIMKDDVLILQRTVGYGINMLTDAVMDQEGYHVSDKAAALELLESKNLLTLDPDPNEPVKFDSSWSKGEVAAASEFMRTVVASKQWEEQKEQEARRNIADSIHFLTNSIARMLDYYKANHKNIDINAIYITGTGVRIKGIDQFFYSEIGMTNKKIEKLWTVSATKKAAGYRKHPSEFISCIGAVINPIDFVPMEFLIKRQKRSAIIATILFALACVAGSVGTVSVAYSDYLVAKDELSSVKDELDDLPQTGHVQEEYDMTTKELESLKQFQESTESNNDNITAVIDELEKKMPTGATINTMQFTENGVSMSITADGTGADGNALVAKLTLQLESVKYFDKVDFSDLSVEEDDVMSKVSFTMNCTYAKQ